MSTDNKRGTLSLKPQATSPTPAKKRPAVRSSNLAKKPAPIQRSARPSTDKKTARSTNTRTKARTETHSEARASAHTDKRNAQPVRNIARTSDQRKTDRSRFSKPAHLNASANEPEEAINERMDISKIHVYRLPPSGLAYQISLAAYLLVAVNQGYSLQQLLAQVPMDEQARPNVQRLTFDVLRHWGTTRFWLKNHINNPPAEWIQAVLCVALTQLLLQEENEFTLVNETVHAIDNNKPHAKGMVNAILRRFLREREAWIALAQTDEVARYNHPQWWIDTLKAQYPNDWQQILTVNNTHPPMTLRVNEQRYSREQYRELLTQNGHSTQLSDLSPQALVLDTPCSVNQLPEFANGAVSVQDAGAQLSAQLMDVRSGQRVLDACAAPGGKTAHMLELHNDIHMTAIEKDEARAQRIHDNLARLQLSAQVLITDANRVHEWWNGEPFERILLDAPCSASGIVRRHPDIRWLRQADDLVGLAQQQAALLRTMWQVLAVGGRLVYCTCSIFTTECSGMIEAFMQHTPNAKRLYPPQLEQLQQSAELGQLLPNEQPTRNHDGFFYAVLEKTDTKV